MRYRLRAGTVAVDGLREWARLGAGYGLRLYPATLAGRALAGLGSPASHVRRERWWARQIVDLLRVDVMLDGLQHIDRDRSYVVAPLHESVIDPVVILQLPLSMQFVVREEVLRWPTVGRYLSASRHVSITPEAPSEAARAMARIQPESGESVVVFPQGAVIGIEAAFQEGPFWIAHRLGMPLLPVVLTGTHRVWEHPYTPTLRTGMPAAMRVLEPIEPGELAPARRKSSILRLQAEMKAMALNGSMPPPRRFDPVRDGFWDGYRYDIDPAFPNVAEAVAGHRKAQAAGRRDPPAVAFDPAAPAA